VTYAIEITLSALEDLDLAYVFIADSSSVQRAERFFADVLQRTQALSTFPLRRSIIRETRNRKGITLRQVCPMMGWVKTHFFDSRLPRKRPAQRPAQTSRAASREASRASVPRSVPCKRPVQASRASVPRKRPAQASRASVPRSVPRKRPAQASRANVPCSLPCHHYRLRLHHSAYIYAQ